MSPIYLQHRSRLTLFLFLLSFVFVSQWVTGWWRRVFFAPVDLDELVWMQDSQIVEWRLNQQWSNFKWQAANQGAYGAWFSPQFRLFDQPHGAKYIYGYWLLLWKINPWSSEIQQQNYQAFLSRVAISDGGLSSTDSIVRYGTETVRAILFSRILSVIFATAFIVLLILLFVLKISWESGFLLGFLLITTSPLLYNGTIATADSFALFWQLVAGISYCKYFYFVRSGKVSGFWFLLTALCTAAALTMKINSWLLLGIWLSSYLLLLLKMKNYSIDSLIKPVVWILLVISSYIYLQPELWSQPLLGLQHFFMQRLWQQHAFEVSGNLMNIVDYHWWIVRLYVGTNFSVAVVKVVLLELSLLGWIFKLYRNKKNFFKNKNGIYWLSLFIVIDLFCFSYARVGFDRYVLWPVCIFSMVIATGVQQLIREVAHRMEMW